MARRVPLVRAVRELTMSEPSPEAKRLLAALDLHDIGVYLYEQRMRRENPKASEGEIGALVRNWLAAPSEDCPVFPEGDPQIAPEAVKAALAAAGLAEASWDAETRYREGGFNAYLIAADGLEACIAVGWSPGSAKGDLARCEQALHAVGYKTELVPVMFGEYLIASRINREET
jgi:hypothetical protein